MNPFILHDLRAGTIHGSDLSKVLPKTKLNETLYAFANLPFVAIFVFFFLPAQSNSGMERQINLKISEIVDIC